jgi:hypothetical protein
MGHSIQTRIWANPYHHLGFLRLILDDVYLVKSGFPTHAEAYAGMLEPSHSYGHSGNVPKFLRAPPNLK